MRQRRPSTVEEGLLYPRDLVSIKTWRLQPGHLISYWSAAQVRLPAMRLPHRNFNDVLNGTASYHEIFQHRYLSIVSSWRKGLTFVLGEIDLPPYPFVRYYFDWGVGSPRLTYVWPLIVFTASTLGVFVKSSTIIILNFLAKLQFLPAIKSHN